MNTINKVLFSILASIALAVSAYAEVSVIVHKSNTAAISDKDISKIFLGKQSVFPGGSEAVPINLEEGKPSRSSFDSILLGKNERQMKAYWSKLVFTGKGTPPKQVEGEDLVLQLISSNPNMIGYVDSSKVTGDVRVIYKF